MNKRIIDRWNDWLIQTIMDIAPTIGFIGLMGGIFLLIKLLQY